LRTCISAATRRSITLCSQALPPIEWLDPAYAGQPGQKGFLFRQHKFSVARTVLIKMKAIESFSVGRKYSESEVESKLGIAGETLRTGVVAPRGDSPVMIFATQSGSLGAAINGVELSFIARPLPTADWALSNLEGKRDLLVFFREEEKSPFIFCGRAEYVAHKSVPGPSFEVCLRLFQMRADASGVLQPVGEADVLKQQVKFVADVHLLKILGEQLITSEKVGILELIKNAYDAGADFCRVRIDNVPGLPQLSAPADAPMDGSIRELPGPVITIEDNGRGMDYQALVNGWLRPATTIKTNVKERLNREREEAKGRGTSAAYERLLSTIRDANSGRLPLGEKGVGRFATHRLGTRLILNTKTADDDKEWKLEIDWNKFENSTSAAVDLSSVPMELVHQPPDIEYGPKGSGTRLRIYGGRPGFVWNREVLRDIGRAIAGLKSPVKAPKGFEPEFICPQLPESFEVPTDMVAAPFTCTALVDENGKADIEIRFTPPASLSLPLAPQVWTEREDLRTGDNDYWSRRTPEGPRAKHPRCGPLLIAIKCWIRRNAWVDAPDFKSFTDYLDQFGGIGIYRNGLSVLPAQDGARRDWLNLERYIIKKGVNISYYNMAGGVEISGEDNPGLIDQTSRQGIIEAEPYTDLARLVRAVVERLNARVKEVREQEERLRLGPSIPKATLNKRIRITGQVLDRLASNYDFDNDSAGIREVFAATEGESPRSIVAGLKRASDDLLEEIARLEEQVDALLESAGYAISVSVSLHEIEKITGNLVHGLNVIRKAAVPGTEVARRAEQMKEVANSLLNELRRLAPLRVSRIEQKKEFWVRDAILAASGVFLHAWSQEKVEFTMPDKAADFKALGSFGGCSQVFANLLDNATYWLRTKEAAPWKIGVVSIPDRRQVIVADNGPGIALSIQEHLFKPFYSLKSPPSGLGLYICRYYMRQFKGDIRLAKEDERDPGFSGAQFLVKFPSLKD